MNSPFASIAKSAIDHLTGLVLVTLLGPIMLSIALLVRLKLGRPVLFAQLRTGLNARPFVLYKFRTMTDERDADGALLGDELRLTRFGRKLRELSLDELPQIVNLLTGDLSLVGPRPLLMEYLPLYSAEQMRRHEVKPGITGWAQVNGRNALTWQEKFRLDVWYVDHRTFWLDLKIIWMTVVKVFRREGINQPGRVTMDRFQGNSSS